MKTFMKLKRILATTVIVLVYLLSNLVPVAAYGKNQYFLSFLYSTETKSFGSIVVQNSGLTKMEDSNSKLNSTKSMFPLTVSENGLTITSDGLMLVGGGTMVAGVSLSAHPYTFPEFGDVDGSTLDYAMAGSVGDDLSRALNAAITVILKPVSTEGRKELNISDTGSFFKIAVAVSNCAYKAVNERTEQNCAYGQLTWKIRPATDNDMKTVKGMPVGATKTDYVTVQNHDDGAVVVPYLVPKGYVEGQKLYGQQATSVELSSITSKLSWGHVIYMASEQYKKGSTVQNPTLLSKEDSFSKMMSKFVNNIFGGLSTFLGLFSVEELMFNAGNRGAAYYYGIMPMSWLSPVSILNIVATVIALLIIGFAIVKMLIQRNVAAITPSAKADLMDGVKDLFIVMMGIALFMPMLYIVLNFNNAIITTLRNMSPSGSALGLASGVGGYGLVEALLRIVYLFIIIMLNITYLIRAVTLALLIGFAPLFISLFAAGGASKKISTTWLKELISNLLMQAFNAAMLLVFANIAAYGTLSLIERFALLISFIPLTKFFKTALMNLGSGSDAVGERTAGAFTNLTAALSAGALLSTIDGKSEKNGKMVSSGGKSGADSLVAPGAQYAQRSESGDGASAKKSLKGSLQGFGKEAGRMAVKGAAVAAGVGVSLGSAATGGNPLVGSKLILSSAEAMANQMEGWGIDDPEGINVAQGHELGQDGFAGFNNDVVMLNRDVRDNINKDDKSREGFKNAVSRYNESPENTAHPVEIQYSDTGENVVGVKIPGVVGKTTQMKDEFGKTIASESSFVGKGSLEKFKPVLNDYRTTPQQKPDSTPYQGGEHQQ